jgi:hypothetical protein
MRSRVGGHGTTSRADARETSRGGGRVRVCHAGSETVVRAQYTRRPYNTLH